MAVAILGVLITTGWIGMGSLLFLRHGRGEAGFESREIGGGMRRGNYFNLCTTDLLFDARPAS
jgi:hypothetical protein